MYTQSGVIPYRLHDGDIELLLITTRSDGRWSIPKGHIEYHLSPQESAHKEAREEAGVDGRVAPDPVGYYQYFKNGIPRRVQVFLLRVDREMPDWPEKQERKRKWFRMKAALKRVRDDELRNLLETVPDSLAIRQI